MNPVLNSNLRRYESLRRVPAYDRFLQERFERCLDLYLCPRMIRKRVSIYSANILIDFFVFCSFFQINIDPESLIPKLPSRKELEPFPKTLSVTYRGHSDRIRCFSVDPSGKWLASGTHSHIYIIYSTLLIR